MSSLKANEPIKIYKYQDLYYYFKTKKPCKVQDQNIIDIHVQNGKYLIEAPIDPVPIQNKQKVKLPQEGINNQRLIELAAKENVKISNKVVLKLKELYPEYDEKEYCILFKSWGLLFDSVSFSQKKAGQLAFHKKNNRKV